MNTAVRSLSLAGLLIALAMATGCATIVKGSKQNIGIQTDPEGASCELQREGQIIGVVSPTPGTVEVEKDKDNIEITCKKQGFKTTSDSISSAFQQWTLGNALIGGVIGVAIDAGSGAAMQYPPAVNLKLTPEKFTTLTERGDFFERWRMEVLQNSIKAKIAAAKICSKEQCDEIVKRIDRETEQALAGIDANRNLRNSSAASAPDPAPQAVQTAQAGPVTTAVAIENNSANDGRWQPRKGDRWKYRMVDGKRPVGTMAIEIIESTGSRVTERITREGSPGFFVERDVQPDFTIAAFVPSVQLPGGYRLVELSAFFPPDSILTAGKIPGQIPGDLDLFGVGRRNLVWDARVAGQERVRVPAGEFDAWKIEATTDAESRHGPMRISYQVWYSPAMQRAVKMALYINAPISIEKVSESLELASFDKAL